VRDRRHRSVCVPLVPTAHCGARRFVWRRGRPGVHGTAGSRRAPLAAQARRAERAAFERRTVAAGPCGARSSISTSTRERSSGRIVAHGSARAPPRRSTRSDGSSCVTIGQLVDPPGSRRACLTCAAEGGSSTQRRRPHPRSPPPSRPWSARAPRSSSLAQSPRGSSLGCYGRPPRQRRTDGGRR
jgi:hypothetical protein